MADQIEADSSTAAKWMRLRAAQQAKSQWQAEEKAAKADLLADLGYDPEDKTPKPCEVFTDDGQPMFEVRIGDRRTLDTKYLKNVYPDVYAEAERISHPVSIKEL